MFLNFNPRRYKDKIFPSPQESAVEAGENAAYEYSVDISALPGLADEVERLRQQWAEGEQAASEAEYICAFIHSDFIFDNSYWGSYFPRYEVLIGTDGAATLSPYDFKTVESAAIERRHKIERHIAENVRIETELKGIRKALFYLLDKYGEREAEAVQDFLKNDEYIRAQIARSPKEGK